MDFTDSVVVASSESHVSHYVSKHSSVVPTISSLHIGQIILALATAADPVTMAAPAAALALPKDIREPRNSS